MRHAIRRAFTFVSVLSGALSLVTYLGWAASCRGFYCARYVPPYKWRVVEVIGEPDLPRAWFPINPQRYEVTIGRGWFSYEHIRHDTMSGCPAGWKFEAYPGHGFAQIPSIGIKHDKTYDEANFPLWLVAGIFAIAPLTHRIARQIQCRRLQGTACKACGYDLRATPGRCPECGATPLNEKHSAKPNPQFAK